jgi:hypothetical protein
MEKANTLGSRIEERIPECSVIFNKAPCTVLKEYPNVQLPSINDHVQH